MSEKKLQQTWNSIFTWKNTQYSAKDLMVLKK